MPPLSQSPFLQTLGYSIINSFWQFALLWLVYVLINTVFKLSPRQKYSAGYILQAGGFVWFIATFIIYFRQSSQLTEITFSLQKPYFFNIAGHAATAGEKVFAWLMQAEMLLPYLSVVYLVLLVFIVARWMKAYSFTQTVRSRGLHETSINWQLFVKQLSARLGIKQEVKIYLSEIVKTPLTIGFLKPLILIPLTSLNHLDADQMEAVILHELAHIRRFDYFFNLFLALTETALFFNPFTILIGRHIKRERENCCDDWVLQYNYNAASYAGALLQIATCQSSSYLFTLKAADNRQVLLNRIKRMIEKKEKTFFNYRYQLLALFVMITVLSSLALLSSRRSLSVSVQPDYTFALKELTAKPDNLIINTVLPLPILPQKTVVKKQRPDKNLKATSSNFLSKTANKNTNYNSIKRQTQSDPAPVQAAEVLFANNDVFAGGFEKDFAESDIRLNEMLSENIHLKEQQIALAKQKFEKAAAKLFEENEAFLNKKQLFEQMKTVIEQIRAAQTNLRLTQRAMLHRQNKTLNVLQSLPVNTEELKIIDNRLRLEINKAKKQNSHLPEPDSIFYNYQWTMPEEMFNFPVQNKSHSFSFELKEKPEAKAFLSNKLKSCKKVKKVIHISFKNAGKNNNSQIPGSLPVISERISPEDIFVSQNFYVINI